MRRAKRVNDAQYATLRLARFKSRVAIHILLLRSIYKCMKKSVILDAATVVGCLVGVGFLSGKEAKLFLGNFVNVIIFAICFFALNIVTRIFCVAHHCFNVSSLAKTCFGRFAAAFTTLFLLCCFVCVVTMLAGVENCLQSYFATQLPMYGMLVAFLAALILKKGLGALKVLNVISILLALTYLICVACIGKNTYTGVSVSRIEPLKYALFSVTMSVGVLAPLSDTTKKGNVVATAIATLLATALIVFLLYIANFSLENPIFDKSNNVFLNVLGSLAVILATATGVAANTLPIKQCLADVFQDDVLCYVCIFCLAIALSMFGFDFALTYGYLFVAGVGILVVTTFVIITAKENIRSLRNEKSTEKALQNHSEYSVNKYEG